mgnify:CR=1 FL=1
MKPVDYRMKLKEKGEMCWKINTGLSSVEEQVAAMKEAEKFNEETGLNISMAHQLPQNITGVPKDKREGLPISLGFMLNEPEDWEAITMASSVAPVFGDNHLGWPKRCGNHNQFYRGRISVDRTVQHLCTGCPGLSG